MAATIDRSRERQTVRDMQTYYQNLAGERRREGRIEEAKRLIRNARVMRTHVGRLELPPITRVDDVDVPF